MDDYSAVLGVYFLNEKLGTLGKIGCATCLIGSVIIVLHAPPDKEVQTVDEILHFAIQPGKRVTATQKKKEKKEKKEVIF